MQFPPLLIKQPVIAPASDYTGHARPLREIDDVACAPWFPFAVFNALDAATRCMRERRLPAASECAVMPPWENAHCATSLCFMFYIWWLHLMMIDYIERHRLQERPVLALFRATLIIPDRYFCFIHSQQTSLLRFRRGALPCLTRL